MRFSVERLQAGDIARFRAMNALFAAVFEDPESYAAAPPSEDYVAALLLKDDMFPLVAIGQGEIIGALVAYELVKFEQARSEI
ncbi:MAG TPA: AAC(3)-I family aminoglycoside 3-N-acetyltransferase, partial [Verrucomicrobiae bacterium]|nr:AAC(3)-I family aminoglycoside 3-N-acetyltransferase [Verrucomicrobiae bacterium]